MVNQDIRTLIIDAQALLQAATTLSGEKAEEMRKHGMQLLDTAMAKARDTQINAINTSKRMAASADGYVRENPWRTIATGAGIGLLLGVILGRR
ncbi:DUF883 family protein [Solimicrobium silvestre]